MFVRNDLVSKLFKAFPDAWIEDPDVSDETRPILEPVRDRLTWDAPIHSIADIEALPWAPKMVNIKPSRVGGLQALCATYDYCAEHGIGAYGGGLTTKPSHRRGCRPARSSPVSRRPAFAGKTDSSNHLAVTG